MVSLEVELNLAKNTSDQALIQHSRVCGYFCFLAYTLGIPTVGK